MYTGIKLRKCLNNLQFKQTTRMRLRVIAYAQSEYWYANKNKGYIMTYKDYSIAKNDDITA